MTLRHNAENCHSSRPFAAGPGHYVKRHKSCDWGHKFQVPAEWAGKLEVGCLGEMMDFLSFFFLLERDTKSSRMACPIVLNRNTARKISPDNHHCLCRISGKRLPTQRVFKYASPTAMFSPHSISSEWILFRSIFMICTRFASNIRTDSKRRANQGSTQQPCNRNQMC